MVTGAWKFWGRQHGKLYCFIVAVDDRGEATRRLANREPMFEVVDVERVPERILSLLEMEPDQVTGWKSLDM